MQTNLKVKITSHHLKNSTNYEATTACPLYIALEEMFPDNYIRLGYTTVGIGTDLYVIHNEGNSVAFVTDDETIILRREVDELIREAKNGIVLEPLNITLTKIEERS